jgi:hypothetical protein
VGPGASLKVLDTNVFVVTGIRAPDRPVRSLVDIPTELPRFNLLHKHIYIYIQAINIVLDHELTVSEPKGLTGLEHAVPLCLVYESAGWVGPCRTQISTLPARTLQLSFCISITFVFPQFNVTQFTVSFMYVIFFSNASTARWGPRPPHFSRLHDHTQTHHTR